MPEVLEWKILYQFGLLSFLSSVKGTHFTDDSVQHWAKSYHIKWTYHDSYHPHSSGLIEN